MENTENNILESRLDENNYDESDLISVRVPALHLSCYTNSRLFERVNGQVEVNGISYKFVKRRLFNDTLELLCIPNHAIMELEAGNNNFFKGLNDLQTDFRGKKNNISSNSHNNPLSEYYMPDFTSPDHSGHHILYAGRHNHSASISPCYLDTPGQPPENG
jgi:hypothetical protein